MAILKGSSIPRVGLIGRPNVGKSTLFNVLTRTRKAMVKNEPGVTRDILIEPAEWWGKKFDVVDTGGITEARDNFSHLIREQVLSVIKSFDLLIVITDGRAGLVPEDRDIVRLAQESGKPFLLVINKVDRMQEHELIESEFYEFGVDIISASFERQDNVDKVVEWIKSHLPEEGSTQREGIRLAVVGKPNVGKSSLCNYLLGEKRMLVSDIAGTTIDAVESEFTYGDDKYILVDTAGMRRAAKRREGVEFLSALKAHKAIDYADIVLLLVDGTHGPTDQDAKVVEYVLEQHKAIIMVANKSDLGKEQIPEYRKWFRQRLAEEFHFFQDLPLVFISAKTGAGIDTLFNTVTDVWNKLHLRITTSKLNNFFYEIIRKAPAPVYGATNVKFYYLTQTQQVPPSFIAFANYPEGVTPGYRRFLAKNIQKHWGLEGIPIRIFVMRSGG